MGASLCPFWAVFPFGQRKKSFKPLSPCVSEALYNLGVVVGQFCRALLLSAGLHYLYDDWDDRYQDDHDRHDVDVLFYERDFPQEVAQDRYACGPQDGTDCRVGEELLRVHPAYAGRGRDERPDDGDEAGQDDCPCAVFLEELVGLGYVFLLEQLGVRLVEQGWA